MKEEVGSIEKNKIWELVGKSIKKPIDVKCVYKLKRRMNGKNFKYKARLVARGFLQKYGINFD